MQKTNHFDYIYVRYLQNLIKKLNVDLIVMKKKKNFFFLKAKPVLYIVLTSRF